MSARAIGLARRRSAIERALGAGVASALARADVVEVMVNADGAVWTDSTLDGMKRAGFSLSAGDREAALRVLAHEAGETIGEDRPVLATVLPDTAARVQGVLPPLAPAPIIVIRKRPAAIFGLEDYVAAGIATKAQAERLRAAVADRRNIVISGGTGSGKTTLVNALLAESGFADARVVLLEDTAELQCSSPNVVQLLTKQTAPTVTMRELVRTTLRLRPDRIVVGEVRDGAALEVLKSWNTGHPGGVLTLHANSAADALARLEDLCLEAVAASPVRLVASAVDLVVHIARVNGPEGSGRVIAEIRRVCSHNGETYVLE